MKRLKLMSLPNKKFSITLNIERYLNLSIDLVIVSMSTGAFVFRVLFKVSSGFGLYLTNLQRWWVRQSHIKRQRFLSCQRYMTPPLSKVRAQK